MRDEAAFRGGEAQEAGSAHRRTAWRDAPARGVRNGGEEGDGRHGAFSGKRCLICPERLLTSVTSPAQLLPKAFRQDTGHRNASSQCPTDQIETEKNRDPRILGLHFSIPVSLLLRT